MKILRLCKNSDTNYSWHHFSTVIDDLTQFWKEFFLLKISIEFNSLWI